LVGGGHVDISVDEEGMQEHQEKEHIVSAQNTQVE
jgi:hypothetical protein